MLGGVNGFLKPIAFVALMLGLLQFAKEAPTLIKDLFAGGDLFKGLNLKPGVKQRIQDNEYAMRGINGISSGVGGAIGRVRTLKKDLKENEKLTFRKGVGGAIAGFNAGAIKGLSSKNRSLKMDDILNESVEGAQRAEDFKTARKQFFDGTAGKQFAKKFSDAYDDIGQIASDGKDSFDVQQANEVSRRVKVILDKVNDNENVKKAKEQKERVMAQLESEMAWKSDAEIRQAYTKYENDIYKTSAYQKSIKEAAQNAGVNTNDKVAMTAFAQSFYNQSKANFTSDDYRKLLKMGVLSEQDDNISRESKEALNKIDNIKAMATTIKNKNNETLRASNGHLNQNVVDSINQINGILSNLETNGSLSGTEISDLKTANKALSSVKKSKDNMDELRKLDKSSSSNTSSSGDSKK